MESLLNCYYWKKGDKMNMEIHATSASGKNMTGLNTEDSPAVAIHRFGVYQIAKMDRK